MLFEIIAAILTLIIFTVAIVAPFVYMLFMQRRDRARRNREEAEVRRKEGEVEQLDLSPEEAEPMYSDRREETEQASPAEVYRRAGERRKGRVENRPARTEIAGREIYRSPETGSELSGPGREAGAERGAIAGRAADGKDEGLMSHIADFSREGLSGTLDARYEAWDEVSRHAGGVGTESMSSFRSVPPSGSAKEPAGGRLEAKRRLDARKSGDAGFRTSAFRRLQAMPDLKRAVVMSEILRPPKALEDAAGSGYGTYR